MTITTKYNIGDKIFVISKNKIKELEIFLIKIHVGRDVAIKYIVIPERQGDRRKFEQDQCFSTKEELLKIFKGE